MKNKKAEDSKQNPLIREQPATYDDYVNLPDDGKRYELADGVLELMSPAPSPKHQVIAGEMAFLIKNSCESEYIVFLSPIDLILSQKEVRQPDLLMVHRSNISIITARGIEGAPDLVVEILSPYSGKRDRQHKGKIYAQYHIPEYWIVDPSNLTLERYLNRDGRYELQEVFATDETVCSDRLPCIAFTVEQIMRTASTLPG
ncbi:MAG: Uma2 family endonuclease [Paenibacillus sp.]|jgi:Uma2 family endonuclease|nr:Uma2 family endonuclease [Paenibacillus sp.]